MRTIVVDKRCQAENGSSSSFNSSTRSSSPDVIYDDYSPSPCNSVGADEPYAIFPLIIPGVNDTFDYKKNIVVAPSLVGRAPPTPRDSSVEDLSNSFTIFPMNTSDDEAIKAESVSIAPKEHQQAQPKTLHRSKNIHISENKDAEKKSVHFDTDQDQPCSSNKLDRSAVSRTIFYHGDMQKKNDRMSFCFNAMKILIMNHFQEQRDQHSDMFYTGQAYPTTSSAVRRPRGNAKFNSRGLVIRRLVFSINLKRVQMSLSIYLSYWSGLSMV